MAIKMDVGSLGPNRGVDRVLGMNPFSCEACGEIGALLGGERTWETREAEQSRTAQDMTE
jgi:hypothetical protein